MTVLIQRATRASVIVEGEVTGEADAGLLVLLGVERDNGGQKVDHLCECVFDYRISSDVESKMSLNVQQTGDSALVASQLTLAADIERGMRPGFSGGASLDRVEALYDYFTERCH